MIVYIPNLWMWFILCFTIFLVTNIIMQSQSRQFFLLNKTIQPFSIFDLEFPASALALSNLVRNIDNLPSARAATVRKALRGQLYTDFIFMIGVYPGIFLLCMQTAYKMEYAGKYVFAVLAWLQAFAWLFDIIENVYLLRKIRQHGAVVSSNQVHKAYQRMEIAKWSIAGTGAICAVFALLYFWIVGNYVQFSLYYLLIIVCEFLLFIFIGKTTMKRV